MTEETAGGSQVAVVEPAPSTPRRPSSTSARTLMLRGLIGVVALTMTVSASAWLLHAGIDPKADPWSVVPPRNGALDGVRSWAPIGIPSGEALVAGNPDLVVVEARHVIGGSPAASTPLVDRLRRRPDGGERLVLARISLTRVCENEAIWRAGWAAASVVTGSTVAEQSRPEAGTPALSLHAAAARPVTDGERVWRVPAKGAPSWLGNEITTAPGCWHVRHGDPAWLAELAGSPSSLIARLIAAGVDGVVLDTDAASEVTEHDRGTEGTQRLRELTARVARRARDDRRGFIVALGDGGEFLADKRMRRIVDALTIAAPAAARRPNRLAAVTEPREQRLTEARADGVLVLVSTRAAPDPATERARLESLGFVVDTVDAAPAQVR